MRDAEQNESRWRTLVNLTNATVYGEAGGVSSQRPESFRAHFVNAVVAPSKSIDDSIVSQGAAIAERLLEQLC